ncbi:dipeptide ABC transporter ATP-binding protein [Roseibium marinum]|uniref:Peptide/nickel transport system ATP-binding protein n=1 Tax=Roseibium marinum TaxID=281252 RepID=A0A2S3UVI5_9HYPH|nr:ABC transporter ATP-binding protein [Roseibium marinum]POF31469.1 peptide/nickel transport system ATP-binding protein [Roseibium marinum]
MSDTVIDVADLSVTLDTPNGPLNAVHEVSFNLKRGESLGIVGESGSGKSMTALALMNLLPRSAARKAGHLRFLEDELTGLTDQDFARRLAGQKIGMIFQEPMTSLNPVYSVGRQLTEGVVRAGLMGEAEARRLALDLMDRVGLPDPKARFDQYPHQFSGGQRQRVMIAMGLMSKPDLMIADEPTTALDVTVQAQILTLMADLQREFGMAMILITHDLGVVAQTVDKVAVMYAGEFVETGPVRKVLGQPRHPYTAALLHAAPELGNERRRLSAIPGRIRPVYGERTACIFENRCTMAEARCRAARPGLQAADAGHGYRCIMPPQQVRVLAEKMPLLPSATVSGGEPVIEISKVARIFTTRRTAFQPVQSLRAVDGVDLTVSRGETFALVGESGSGKSTLARMLLGLDTPSEGDIRISGQPVSELSGLNRARLVQPIFQDPYSSLNPRRSIGETIAQPLAIHRIGTRESRRDKVRGIMDLVGLPGAFLHNYPSQLSGGQRQRVAIARALIMQPEILVCDEPTSALDVSVQAQILNLLADLKAEVGLTLFLITHDIGVVHQIADRVAVMKSGRIVEAGSSAEVLQSPKENYTQALLSAVPSTARALNSEPSGEEIHAG